MVKGGVLHRGPVCASKRGRNGVGARGLKQGKRQEVALSGWGRVTHPGAEKGQGVPGKDRETSDSGSAR